MTLAKCHTCGRELIAPYDGMPYWCTECSYEDDLKVLRQSKDGE
jgi:DNA-directed RNA polymerase subunit RPC12/RpoP